MLGKVAHVLKLLTRLALKIAKMPQMRGA